MGEPALYKNLDCLLCAEGFDIEDNGPSGRRLVRSFLPGARAREYRYLIVTCHGRRERTEVVRFEFTLSGGSAEHDQRLHISRFKNPRDWRRSAPWDVVLGTVPESKDPRGIEDLSSGIDVGRFLVFGDSVAGTTRVVRAPVAHIEEGFASPFG